MNVAENAATASAASEATATTTLLH